jgi:C4-dicarboxylate-specific signal transduction histidine kinase
MDCLALLQELSESLTAIQNYAAGARHLAEGQSSADTARLASGLELIIGQVHRAADVMRRLRSLVETSSLPKEHGA